ncbi:uncharacterized protein LOC119728381 isoform X1 [Patiria miniata]|uniref:Uncharacterized protein n=1 Tax=Patiria miniata TaxID=46514 RepID=A0A913ZY92_PATMI|nr:uncharacterized protein LOC119728381 isoform X1 [Patiria miniata]
MSPGVLGTRQLSCFCNNCMGCSSGECANFEYVTKWKKVTLGTNHTSGGKILIYFFESSRLGKMLSEMQLTYMYMFSLFIKLTCCCFSVGKKSQDVAKAKASHGSVADTPRVAKKFQRAVKKQKSVRGSDADANGVGNTSQDVTKPKGAHGSSADAQGVEHLAVGDFVQVSVEVKGKTTREELFVAKIVDLTDCGVRLTYMRRQGAFYTWPLGEEHIYHHPLCDVKQKLSAPEPVLIGSRMVFNFKK